MYDVFISYSSVNQYIADAICHRVEGGGMKCWYAPRNIGVGEDWPAAIMRAIHQSKVFVLIYSANSNKSKQVIREVAAAVESECVIVPFRIDESQMCDSLSYYLSGVHWMDAMNLPLEKSIENLFARIWWLVHPRQVPQQDPRQPYHPPVPPNPPQPVKREKKKKGKTWIIILGLLVLLGVIGIFAEALAQKLVFGDQPEQPTETAPVQQTVQQIPFYNLSQLEQFSYPFYQTNMFSNDLSSYFVRNNETGILSCVKTDTGFRITDDIDYDPNDPFSVYTITENHYDVIYFLEEAPKLVKIYDKTTDRWVNEKGIFLDLKYQEVIVNGLMNMDYISGETVEDNLYLLIYDNSPEVQCCTRVIVIHPDGSREDVDIRHLELCHYITGIDKPGCHVVAMMDKQNNVKLLDVTTMEVLDIPYEHMVEQYLPYHTEGSNVISQTGRYICRRTTVPTGTKVTVWDLQQQKQVFSKIFTKNHSVFFMGEDKLLVFNAEDTTLVRYDLQTGRSVQHMDKNTFEGSEHYSSLPFAFFYTGEPNVCFFVSTAKVGEDGWGAVVTMTDLDGTVLAKSDVLEIPFDEIFVDVLVRNWMIFFEINVSDPYNGADGALGTLVYRVKYSYNAQGELIFIQ